jgi:hypothetical protein
MFNKVESCSLLSKKINALHYSQKKKKLLFKYVKAVFKVVCKSGCWCGCMIKTKNTTRSKNGIVIKLSLLDCERMGKNLIRMSNFFFFVNVVSI